MKTANNHIKFAPFGRRTLVPRAVYVGRYVAMRVLVKQWILLVSPMEK